jgi:hypothetical protein
MPASAAAASCEDDGAVGGVAPTVFVNRTLGTWVSKCRREFESGRVRAIVA